MKLTLDTTPEQDKALAQLNTQSNPGSEPPIEEFAASAINDFLDSLGLNIKRTDVATQAKVLQDNADKLSDADAATIKSIVAKLQAAQADAGAAMAKP